MNNGLKWIQYSFIICYNFQSLTRCFSNIEQKKNNNYEFKKSPILQQCLHNQCITYASNYIVVVNKTSIHNDLLITLYCLVYCTRSLIACYVRCKILKLSIVRRLLKAFKL